MRTEYLIKGNFTFSSTDSSVQLRCLTPLNYFVQLNDKKYCSYEPPKVVLENNSYYLWFTSITVCDEVLCDKEVKLMLDNKSIEQWLKSDCADKAQQVGLS